MILINLQNAYLLLSLVNISDAELKKKRQRALELKQFLLDNKVRLILFYMPLDFPSLVKVI